MSNRLEGKVAVITGAASGIGEASARRFAAQGCRVVLGDIQVDAGEALSAELGDNAVFAQCNVTSEDDVSALVDLAVSEFDQLDIMFNNAGIVGGLAPHAYAAAKHAVVGLTKNVAAEVCGYGVRVNAIAPYSVATSMIADAYLHDHKAIDEATKMLADESPLVNRPGLAL